MQGVYATVVIDKKYNVAIKQYKDPLDTQSFIREVYSLMLLRHIPQVIQLVNFNFQERRLHLEIGDETLTACIDQRLAHSISWGTSTPARQLLWQMIVGLQAVNQQGVWHRDIKPDNIMLVNGRLKLIDFGLAKIDAYQSVLGTNPVYTTWWRAPELLVANVLDIDYHEYDGVAAEIYSTGSVFLCMLLGNDHGIMQASTEKKQLEEVLQMDGTQWELMSIAFLEECAPKWRKKLFEKLKYSPKSSQSSLHDRVLAINSSVTLEALDLLSGMLHPNYQKRFTYSKILQHQYFDAIRIAVPGPTPTPAYPSSFVPAQVTVAEYRQVLSTISTNASRLQMTVYSKVFLLSLFRSFLDQRTDTINIPILINSCLFIADALYSNQPTTLKILSDLSQVDGIEAGIQQLLISMNDLALPHPRFESLFTEWGIDVHHQHYSELLRVYFILDVSGLHVTHTIAEIVNMCILILRP